MSKQFPIKNNETTFGMHLMLDAYGVSRKPLDDMKLIYNFLYTLPAKIDMTMLTTPLVANADLTASGKDPGGISGFVMINESHISIHTFPDKGFFSMDLYSCSNFEEEVDNLLKFIKETFPFTSHELQIVKRGTRYPM